MDYGQLAAQGVNYQFLKTWGEQLHKKINGTETIVLVSQQYKKNNNTGKADVFANAIKHDFRSKNPTTRWNDILKLK